MQNDLRKLLLEYSSATVEKIQETVVAECKLSFEQIRDRLYLLGNILYEDLENQVYVAYVRAGIGNMSEIVDGVLMDRNGNNVDAAMGAAVAKAMELIRKEDIQCAILQSRSPTCGVNEVYDGSFSGKLIPGSGVLAQALKDAGYQVIDAEDIKAGA